MVMFSGCYTALVTPMTENYKVDYEGLKTLVEFQVKEGVSGILAVGTTGESPTLDWNEHNKVIETVYSSIGENRLTIAGTGSNSTAETLKGTNHAAEMGVKAGVVYAALVEFYAILGFLISLLAIMMGIQVG